VKPVHKTPPANTLSNNTSRPVKNQPKTPPLSSILLDTSPQTLTSSGFSSDLLFIEKTHCVQYVHNTYIKRLSTYPSDMEVVCDDGGISPAGEMLSGCSSNGRLFLPSPNSNSHPPCPRIYLGYSQFAHDCCQTALRTTNLNTQRGNHASCLLYSHLFISAIYNSFLYTCL
jgi:hypothetical protein